MKKIICAFGANTSGGVMLMAPAIILVMCGFTALTVDVGQLYYTKLKLQKVADNAATGAVFSLPTAATVQTKALDLVTLNTPTSFGTVSTSACLLYTSPSPRDS